LAYLGVEGLKLLETEVEGKIHLLLVDSGASLSVMQPGVSCAELQPTQTPARGITGNKLKTTGIRAITFRVGSKTFKEAFDRFSHNYLYATLREYGFSERFRT